MKKKTSKERKRDERKSKSAARPTRHARIMRGVVTPILGLLAVACIGLGIMNATYWKPSSQIAASAAVKGTQYIVTDPGVLPLVDNQVTVSADAGSSDGEVCLALGSNKDVIGWLARQPYVRVTGLNEWTTLATTKVSAQGSAADAGDDAVAFKDSDMWTSVTCGTGTVKAETKVASDSGTVAIIDLGKSSNATVRMNWVRQTLPDFAMPFYFAGGLLALLAVLAASLFAMPPHKRRFAGGGGQCRESQGGGQFQAEIQAPPSCRASWETRCGHAGKAGNLPAEGRRSRQPQPCRRPAERAGHGPARRFGDVGNHRQRAADVFRAAFAGIR